MQWWISQGLHLDLSHEVKVPLCPLICWYTPRVFGGAHVQEGKQILKQFYGWGSATWRPLCLWKSRRICTSRNRLLVSCHAGSRWWSRNLTSSQLNKSQPSVWTTRIDFFLKYPQSLNAFVKFLSLCTQCQPQLNNEGSPRKLLTNKQPMLPVMKATSYCLVY